MTLTNAVIWKSVQDRYKIIQNEFDKCYKKNSLRSEVGREVVDMKELSKTLHKARDEMEEKKGTKSANEKMLKNDKEVIGAVVI